jgi:D-beta-D-heptose 7-phosphate kinase/D-beta-D-heptose 1-phosphate adenosyltransferase
MYKYTDIISNFGKKTILVIGDIILDRHIQGSVSRISPEAPVPIVLQEKVFCAPGGAANVSNNLRSLKTKVIQVGKIGSDSEGQLLKNMLKKKGIGVGGVFIDKVPTITKTRVIAQHQQVVRIDKEDVNNPGTKAINNRMDAYIKKAIKSVDAIIVSDYGKGMITPELLEKIKDKGVPVVVDPKVEHFDSYKGVTAITPNKKEAENAIRNIKIKSQNSSKLRLRNDKLTTLRDIDIAGEKLLKYLDLDSLLITIGEQGMRLFEKRKKPYSIETKVQQVFDVTGAGDTVISVFTLALISGATKRQAAEIANVAAGIVVGQMGAATITKQELLEALKGHK